MRNIRIGRVDYLNTLPLFYRLDDFTVVKGHPADLVKKIREGEIDAGIISSAEYFFNPDDYFVLPRISVSSRGSVCSVLLLSEVPAEEIKKVRITPRSLTSRYLLLYFFDRMGIPRPEEVPSGEDAILAIGDDALENKDNYPYSYDLGEQWYRLTGLPFVFALFLVRKGVPQRLITELYEGILYSKESFFRDMEEGRIFPDDTFVRDYLTECIDYELGKDHLDSLEIFFGFMERETGKPAPDSISLFRP